MGIVEILGVYFLGFASSATSDVIFSTVRSLLDEEKPDLKGLASPADLATRLKQIGQQDLKLLRQKIGRSQLESPLLELLADPGFCDALADWLLQLSSAEAKEKASILSAKISEYFKQHPVSAENSTSLAEAYLDRFVYLVNSDFVVSNWLRSLSHRRLHDKIDQLRGKFSENEIEAAVRRYYEVLLKHADLFDLGELGSINGEVAHSGIRIRELYVPLRVIIPDTKITNQRALIELKLSLFREIKHPIVSLKENPSRDKSKRKSIGDLIRSGHHFVVLGDPGSGKTTVLRWLTAAFTLRNFNPNEFEDLPDSSSLPSEFFVPFLIECRSLNGDSIQNSIRRIIADTIASLGIETRYYGPLFAAVEKFAEEGQLLLLIDGLDEILDLRLRHKFVDHVQSFSRAARDVSIFATSRFHGYAELGSSLSEAFEEVAIAPLTHRDKERFSDVWCKLTERPENAKQASEELKAAIRGTQQIRELSNNPLLLTTIALVVKKHGKIPERRVKIYEEAVDLLLRWRSRTEGRIDSKVAVPQLAYLAYAMIDRGKQREIEDMILEDWDRLRQDFPKYSRRFSDLRSADFLKELERRSAILLNVGFEISEGEQLSVFEFRHLSFQDYLAACALVMGCYPDADEVKGFSERLKNAVRASYEDVAKKRQQVRERGSYTSGDLDSRWLEPIRLSISKIDDIGLDVEEALNAVLSLAEEDDALLDSCLALVVRCLSDEPDVNIDFACGAIRQYLELAISQSKPGLFWTGSFTFWMFPGPTDSECKEAWPSLAGSSWKSEAFRILDERIIRQPGDVDFEMLGMFGDLGARGKGERSAAWYLEELRSESRSSQLSTVSLLAGAAGAAINHPSSDEPDAEELGELIECACRVLKSSECADELISAMYLILVTGSEKANDQISELLIHPKRKVRKFAINTLGNMAKQKTKDGFIPPLVAYCNGAKEDLFWLALLHLLNRTSETPTLIKMWCDDCPNNFEGVKASLQRTDILKLMDEVRFSSPDGDNDRLRILVEEFGLEIVT